jgi:predicted amidohydrolase YtcJ
MNRIGSLNRYGVPLAFGSDSPVTPLAGWETVRAAVQHHQPSERLDTLSAFDAATRGAHYAAGDDSAGTLTPGSRASFAVWDTSAAGGAADSSEFWGLPDVGAGDAAPECVLTVASGRVVFTAAVELG